MEKYLPIGTVVLLKDAQKKVMIIGYAIQGEETKDKIYDYLGCLYPEGVLSSDENLVFDHSGIEKIVFLGYSDDEWKELEKLIKDSVAKLESGATGTTQVPGTTQQPGTTQVPGTTQQPGTTQVPGTTQQPTANGANVTTGTNQTV